MVFAQPVLVRPLRILAAGVDEQHVLRAAALLEQQNHGGNARAEEQLLRQADDRLQQVLLDKRLADAPFTAAPEEHAMRGDDAYPAPLLLGALDHVADEGVVALALGRHAPVEPVELVRFRVLGAPLVQREGRVGYHHVELHQGILLYELRAPDGVAPRSEERRVGKECRSRWSPY